MKNIHVLPTDKASRLHTYFNLPSYYHLYLSNEALNWKEAKHIYITDDSEIKEDYVIAYGFVIKVMMFEEETLYFINGTKAKREDCKKIILTTDQDLIKDGVQAVEEDFLNWFVNNPRCEEVGVELLCGICRSNNGECLRSRECSEGTCKNIYKIIIPKEEPKQQNCCTPIGQIKRYTDCVGCDKKPKQETLEEAAKKYAKGLDRYSNEDFINGAEWQAKRMYSEEEVELIANEMVNWALDNVVNPNPKSGKKFDEVLNKFKNK